MVYPSLSLEFELLQKHSLVAGIDEVGRGCLAGPVFAGIITLTPDSLGEISTIKNVRDSKTLSETQREVAYHSLVAVLPAFAVGSASPQEIDLHGIRRATHLAMLRAYWTLQLSPNILLMDGESATIPIMSKTFQYNHGDSLHWAIAAASIIAKVTRDRLMVDYERIYPEYAFSRHKGYGTSLHFDALRKFGATPIHRLTFL